jgi:hypothetical protein
MHQESETICDIWRNVGNYFENSVHAFRKLTKWSPCEYIPLLERVWKELAVSQLEVLPRYLFQLAVGWKVWGSNPECGEIFYTRPTDPEAHPASYKLGTGSFLKVKRPGRGVNLLPYPI